MKRMEKLWEKLPHELQVQIVTRLSAENICRLRLTCKYFYSFFSNPSIAIEYDRAAHPNYLVRSLSWARRGGSGLSFSHDIVLCVQHEDVMSRSATGPRLLQRLSNVSRSEMPHLLTSGDGFLCFEASSDLWWVVNPLFPGERCSLNMRYAKFHTWLRGIAFDRKHGVCKLVLFSSSSSTYVYNFKENMWKIMERGPNWKRFCHKKYRNHPIIVNERFVCWQVSTNVDPAMVQETAVVVFDVENDSWQELISIDKELFKAMCITEHNKQLCAISQTKGEKGEIILQLWKFDMENRTWKPSEYIPPGPPENISPVGTYHFHESYRLWGGRGFVWAMGFEYEGNINRKEMVVWVYDISGRSWHKVAAFEYAGIEIPDVTYSIQNIEQIVECFEGSLFKLR